METAPNAVLKLAPPGAGLPSIEAALSRILFILVQNSISRKAAENLFRAEARLISEHIQNVDSQAGATPVLIPRVFGIEDSSRCWSIYMTLEHLVIVNNWIIQIISDLVIGKCHNRKVTTQDVKPVQSAGQETVFKFAEGVERYVRIVGGFRDLKTRETHIHPWFGALNAQKWHCLAAIHQRIHRRQIDRILQGLKI